MRFISTSPISRLLLKSWQLRPQTSVVQPLHGIVDVQSFGGFACRLDVPRQHRHAEAFGNVLGQDGLAGAGLTLEQQRPFERDGAVDRVNEWSRRDIPLSSLEASEAVFLHARTSIVPPRFIQGRAR